MWYIPLYSSGLYHGAMGQLFDCPRASDAILKDTSIIPLYQSTTKLQLDIKK